MLLAKLSIVNSRLLLLVMFWKRVSVEDWRSVFVLEGSNEGSCSFW